MPTIEVSKTDLCKLIGRPLTPKELEDAVLYAKCEIDSVGGDILKIDSKDTNRPDLWSAEGIAREIAGRMGNPGLPVYRTKKSDIKVIVDPKLKNIRPFTVCAAVKNLNITEDVLSQMIQLQEKVSLTFGRNRREVAIGVYDLHKITPPIRFTTTTPEGIRFVPLEFTREMTPREILQIHPKGREFAHLLDGAKEYPVFIDNADEVLSMPPIINSEYTGKVTEHTRDVFIECSGFNLKFLLPALNVIVSALADRGGEIETVDVLLPGGKRLVTPDLKPKKTKISLDFINKVSGLSLSPEQAKRLLEQARYEVKTRGRKFDLQYPAYRQDIMHMRDIAEDVIISYGYNRITPEPLKIATRGEADKIEVFSEKCAELMIGFGYQEILSHILTNKNHLFKRMLLPEENTAEIENYVSENWNVFRNWLIPSLMEFLSRNRNQEYPQKVFEIGDCVLIDVKRETRTRDVRKLALALADTRVGYEDVSGVLESFLSSLGAAFFLKPESHPSFIPGRCAGIVIRGKKIGIIGEIHPQVLENWNIDKPVAGFELDMDQIFTAICSTPMNRQK
ncbi:MAG: phenylalanine--tRNA ligase subunit beta [Chloroflexi bacterium]|nr:MAG: phenylalanine--tRNA ligase subunit beta [Chloroflexota bacterium]